MNNQRVVVSRFGGPECLRVVEEDLPRPGTGEVRVRVLAAGVSFADLLMREGVHPERRRPPFTLGWDIVGRVDAVGEDGHGIQEGDAVAALTIIGGYSRYLCLPAADLVKVPSGVHPALAVCLVMDYVVGYALNLWPDGRKVALYSIQMRKRRHPTDYGEDLAHLLRLLCEGEISPVIAHTFDLAEAAQAHELLARKTFPGKIVLASEDIRAAVQ